MPVGVVAVAKMNSKYRFFLASTQNDFVGHKVDKVMIDNGCSSLLLPLRDGELITLPAKYPPESHVWRITDSRGVSHSSVFLNITLKTGLPMGPIFLCADLIPSNAATTSDRLRFHLCTEDMNLIINTPALSSMFKLAPKLQPLKDYLRLHHVPIRGSLIQPHSGIPCHSL